MHKKGDLASSYFFQLVCGLFLDLLLDQNASVIRGEEGGDRKKAAAPRATKPNVQEPAANAEEAEPERSDSDESEN
jgi:hypothetical protein